MAMTRLSRAHQKMPPRMFSTRIVPKVVPFSAAAAATG